MGRPGSRGLCAGFVRAAAVVLVSVAVVCAGAVPGIAATQYRFFQFNTAGNVRYGGDEQAAIDIANSIVAFRPHIATINEICLNQASALDSQLTARGYPMSGLLRNSDAGSLAETRSRPAAGHART